MHTEDPVPLSDRQARAVIIAAEALGFQREPDLYEAWYDHLLHEDAQYAVRFLRARAPDALREALVADEPIPADDAALRITDSGRFSFADVEQVLAAATERGFSPPPTGLGMTDWMSQWDQGRAAVAFLWDTDPSLLAELIGETAQIAPLPDTARRRGHHM